jgi:hypothetical protein
MEETTENLNEIENDSIQENSVEDSILNSIKKLLGIAPDYTQFDSDVIMHINSVFMVLNQLGIGPEEGFRITNADDKWTDYITNDDNLDAIKTYIHLKVKIAFDPPLNSTVMEAHKQMISELEWRLNVQSEKS